MAKEKFEEALNKLEKIVSTLEKGDIPLDESLKLFEEGVRLSRFCNQKLDEAEKRVEILLRDKEGLFKSHPFDPSNESGRVSPYVEGETTPGPGESPPGSRRDEDLASDGEE